MHRIHSKHREVKAEPLDLRAIIRDEIAALMPEPQAEPRFQSEDRISDRYGVEKRALRAGRDHGELVGHRVGRRVLLEVAEVEAWIASRAEQPKTKVKSDAANDPLDAAIASGRLQIGGAAFLPRKRTG